MLQEKVKTYAETIRDEAIEKGKIEIAKKLLDILGDKTITEKTGLSVNETKKRCLICCFRVY